MEPLAAVAAVVTIITALIGLFKGLRTAYGWAKKNEGEKRSERFITFLHWVEQKVQEEAMRRMNSKCSKTSITADLKPLEGELKESWSFVNKWKEKNFLRKLLASKKYIEKVDKSENAITQRLREFSSYTRRYEVLEGNHAAQQKPPERKGWNHGNSRRKREKEREETDRRKREKEREKTEYRAWLKKNITKITDSWTRYPERATNSKLDSAKKEILFRKHMEGLHEKYQQYRELLKEFIKPESENKYLTSWSAAEDVLQGHQRFDRFPEREREREWSSHVKQISKKKAQISKKKAQNKVKGTSVEKGKGKQQ